MTVRTAAHWMSRLFCVGLFFAGAAHADVAYKVDHTDVALFDQIPDSYLDQIRQMTVQYTGQSHGRQLPHGLELLAAMDSKYAVQMSLDLADLDNPNALKVIRTYYQYQLSRWFPYDTNDDDDYWSTPDARAWTEATASRAISQGQPLTLSLWCWCWDFWRSNWVHNEAGALIDFNDERMTAYLNAISSFNSNGDLSPTVFIYHTSITDEPDTDEHAWDITRYNDQIRAAAAANNGILFDQADIENWNEAGTNQRTGTWDGHTFYLRHTDYDQNVGVEFEVGHTNDALCIRKAKAFWVLLAKMSGWDGGAAVDPTLNLTSPNGGESLTAGNQHTITWTSSDVSAIDIEFSSNNGSSWSTVASDVSAASGSYAWTVPSVASSQCRIRVTESSSGSVTDTSTITFTITVPVVPALTLTSPDGGENLTAGSQHNITWTSANITAVDISFSSNNGSSWSTVASDVSASAGSYAWTVPSVASSQCRIRVTESSSGSVTDTSAAVFTITVADDPELFLLRPNGGENLTAGNQYYIRWSSTDITAIDILFSSNNRSTWTTVASNVSVAGGTYAWTVPATASTQCYIRITESGAQRVTDTSTLGFTITVPSGDLWGDVDDDESVTVSDALKIATYDINPDHENLVPILTTILGRGDVNADDEINSTDALICASYDVNPDNPYNPPRVGNTIGSVPKITAEPVADALPDLLVLSDGVDVISVQPSISPSEAGIAIGASKIRITWDPEVFSFVEMATVEGVVTNNDHVSTGEMLLARIDVNGAEIFAFPLITFQNIAATQTDAFTMEVLTAAAANTFETLSTEHGYVSQVVGVEDETPAIFTLEQNSPNPFNPETTIRFTTDRAGEVALDIYNMQGQLVTRLINRYLTPGLHEVRWDGMSDHAGPAASGIYIYQLRMDGCTDQKPMVLLR